MITPEGEWVLDQFQSVDVSDYGATLTVVDRDNSDVLEGNNIRSRKTDLQDAVYVGAGTADRSREAIGTDADYDTEVTIGVRIEGLHTDEFGDVDPGGSDGIPFGTLVDRLQDAIDTNLSYPTIPNGDHNTHVLIQNEVPQPFNYADYYRYDFDAVVHKYEDR